MARIQVLNLPAPPDEYPFALVIDRLGDEYEASRFEDMDVETGARGLLLFAGTVEVDPIDHDDPPPKRYSAAPGPRPSQDDPGAPSRRSWPRRAARTTRDAPE